MRRVTLDDGSWWYVDDLTYEQFFADPPPAISADDLQATNPRWNTGPRKPPAASRTRTGEPWEARRAAYLRRKA